MARYNLYTDASFDSENNIATYSIIIKSQNKILKSFSKRCRIKIKNSTEIEVFAVFQAMNLILSCYINKNKEQKFCINTDCVQVLTFFEDKNNKMKVFKDNEIIKNEMLKTYEIICTKLSRRNCSFTLKWISRDLNKIAHNKTYNMLKRLRKVKRYTYSKEDVLINRNTLFEILSGFNKNQNLIVIHLFNIANTEGLILVTQKEISRALNISITTINRTFNKLKKINILEKIKNGKYMLLV